MAANAEGRYSDCIAGTWLAERLALDPLRIEAMRRSGELIAVRKPGAEDWRYPAWQFDAWKPRRGIARIVAAGRAAGLDETGLYDLMTARLGLTGSPERLADLMAEGREDEVVAAIRRG